MAKRTLWRPIAAVLIIALTIAFFVDYFVTHPEVRHELSNLSLATISLLLALYIIFTGSLALINAASVRLCRSRISGRESILLTMYSAVVNFFGPLQSGPAFRALYLKKKHDIGIKNYTVASFIYYFFYALFSGLLLISGILGWWLIPIALLICAAALYSAKTSPQLKGRLEGLDLGAWPYMAVATLLQVCLMIVIYGVELHTVSPDINFSQILIYTGAGNLALFVSLTPGAIGFRESFLLFSQHLHHIDTATIVSANILDRTVYILMLALIALYLFITHGREYIRRGVAS